MDVAQSDQAGAGPDVSNSDVVKSDVANESMDGEQIESDSDQIDVSFSTARSKYSNAVGKRSIAGPSVNRNER